MSDATEIASPGELRDNARAITEMVAFREWKAAMEGQIEGRRAAALEPIKSMEAALERNYQNGEVAGMMTALVMWAALIEAWDADARRQILQAEEKGEEK